MGSLIGALRYTWYYRNTLYFVFTWYISMTFSRFVWMVGNLLFFVYWFSDGVRSTKEVQKPSRPFWIYISMFTEPIWFILDFLFLNFYYNIYFTNTIIHVYEVNNGEHYHLDGGQYSKILTDELVYYPTYLYFTYI